MGDLRRDWGKIVFWEFGMGEGRKRGWGDGKIERERRREVRWW